MANIGNSIKRARKMRGLSQAQLAQKLGVTKQTISNYENEVREPDFETLDSLSVALNVSLSYLIGASDDPVEYPKPDANDPGQDPYVAKGSSSDDDDLWTLRESLRDDPNRRLLFHLAKNATAKDVEAAASLIDALRATNPDFYDGEDPA